MKLMFMDVKKAHHNAGWNQEERVELSEEIVVCGKVRQRREVVVRREEGDVGVERRSL